MTQSFSNAMIHLPLNMCFLSCLAWICSVHRDFLSCSAHRHRLNISLLGNSLSLFLCELTSENKYSSEDRNGNKEEYVKHCQK